MDYSPEEFHHHSYGTKSNSDNDQTQKITD